MATIPDDVKAMLDEPVYVHLATINPDGSPQVSVIWIERDGDLLRFSTVVGRVKPRNLARDPRVALSFSPPDRPFRNVTLSGRVIELEERGMDLIDRLAHKYTGSERYEWAKEGQVRIDATIEVDRVSVYG